MAKFRYQHIKSSVEGKAPTAAQLKVAEIGVNDFAGDEKLFIKNSEGDVVDFPRGYSRQYINEFEETTAASLNDLEDKKLDKADLPNYDEQFEVIAASLNDLEEEKQNKLTAGTGIDITNDVISITGGSTDVEEELEVIAASLNDLEERKANKTDVEEQFEVVAASLNDLEDKKLDKVDFDEAQEVVAASLNDLEDRKLDKADMPDYDEQFEVVAASLNDLESNKASKTEDLDGIKLKKITQSDYDALVQAGTTDSNTLYIIID